MADIKRIQPKWAELFNVERFLADSGRLHGAAEYAVAAMVAKCKQF